MKSTTFLAAFALAGSCSLPCLAAPKSTVKTQQELEKEVVALREKVKKQQQMLRSWREMVTGIGGNAVRAPFGRFLLIKNGSQCLALRITEHANSHAARYEWFLQTDGSMDFSKDNVQKRSGEVSDFKNETYQFASIRAGSFPPLEWSSGDWIYFTFGGTPVGGHQPGSEQALREKNMRMASTEWVRIKDVNPQSSTLVWLSKEQTKGDSQ